MLTRFTLRQLEYFIAVGESGSIALAAERVNISSPSISAAISQLEAEFGIQLFVRKHAHGLSLTQGGREFMQQARIVVAEAMRLNDLANSITGKVRGPLAVGCLTTFAQVLLPQVRRRFAERFPEVEFRQFERHQAELFEGIRNATLDVALTYDLGTPPDLEFIGLIKLPPYVLLHEDHELATRPGIGIKQLSDHPMILLDLPFSSDYFLSLFARAGVKPKIAERTRDIAVMRSLVANGFGYSIANIRPVTDRAPDGRKLIYVPLAGNAPALTLGLLMSEGSKQSMTVRAFVDHCHREITSEKTPGLNLSLERAPHKA
jgi:DNA-binding transcriptional LysR family regulator